MAGKHKLVGRHAHEALHLLDRVTKVFTREGVRYWLESGTLLGVVREQRLLPWDTDLDLAVDSADLPALRRAIRRLRLSGYFCRYWPHRESIGPLAKHSLRLAKIYSRSYWLLQSPMLLDVFVKYRHDDQYYWSVGNRNRVLKSAPARFYDTLDSISFDGREYAVPGHVDAYLTHRYGNWRVPVHEWDFRKDDLAVVR